MFRRALWSVLAVTLAAVSLVLAGSPGAEAQAPVVTIGAADGQNYLGPEVVVSGTATSPDGIASVTATVLNTDTGEYVQPGGLFAPTVANLEAWTALMPPPADSGVAWRVPMPALADGNYTIEVTVTTELGAGFTAPAKNFVVVSSGGVDSTLVAQDSVWSYFDLGEEPASQGPDQWFDAGYDASTWATGAAELGYGDGDEVTPISATDPAGTQLRTAYFRQEFTVTDPTSFSQFTLRALRDDGIVIYLNGEELGRDNMPFGNITYSTWASSTSEQVIEATVTPDQLVVGTNVIAAEVHQVNLNSSDISFWLSIEGVALNNPLESDATEGTYVLTAGDMAKCTFSGDEAVADQMDELWDTDQGVFLGLGDLAYQSGSFSEFTNCFDPTIGRHKTFIWPNAGNHEHYTTPNAAGYRQYFGPAAGPNAGPAGGLWYSFDIDDHWHVIALDSDCRGVEPLPGSINGDGCAPGSEQELWLRATLEANQDKNLIAFFHHPPYTNNHYTDHQYTWPLWRALAEYGVEMTLHGHEHHYERYGTLDYWGDRDPVYGIRQFIIGTGGTQSRFNYNRTQVAESDFRAQLPSGVMDFGVLQLWLRPDGYSWKWESIFGQAPIDEGTSGLTQRMPLADLTGTLTATGSPGETVPGVEVCAVASRTGIETCTTSDAAGAWTLGPLVSDDYSMTYTPPAGSVYFADTGQETLTAPTNTVVGQTLDRTASISGLVAVIATGLPADGATVCATDSVTGVQEGCATTNSGGSYTITGLRQSTYVVDFTFGGTQTQCYLSNGDCLSPSIVDITTGDAVGIDAALTTLLGDMDCSANITLLDARVAAQYAIDARTLVDRCPLGNPDSEGYGPAGDMDGSGAVTLIDARHIARCAIGTAGPGCPNPA